MCSIPGTPDRILIIVCDNGPEFAGRALDLWTHQRRVQLDFIQPGKPVQNAFVESFNGKFRDECLNQHWFRNLWGARRVIAHWRQDYNEVRPHSSFGDRTPSEMAQVATNFTPPDVSQSVA